jgi:DNA-binding NarL/FixJ family response regulator
MIRVVLVDDHHSMLWGLRKLIESAAPLLELAATAGCAAEALAAARQHRPDIVLLDLDLGDGSDVGLVSQLQAAGAGKILILTGSRDLDLQQRAVMAGARGLVHKSEPAEVILEAIAQVHAGELWLDRATISRVFASLASPSRASASEPHESLTPAERRVMVEVVRHKSAPNKVIADALHISAHTLRNHLASIYGKLGLKRRLDLVLYALERRLDRTTA